MNPISYGYPVAYRTSQNGDERFLPVIPFLAGLAVAPFVYGAFHHGGYYPPPYYYPYQYYGPRPPYYHGYY